MTASASQTAQAGSKQKLIVDGLLFDMDGTLIDSTPGVLATWEVYGREHGLDLQEVLRTSHGIRTEDNLRNFCNIQDPEQLKAETARFEDMILAEGARLKSIGQKGLEILPGVKELLASLPADRWAIVTSATRYYCLPALKIAGLEPPSALVTADIVKKGKPDPEPYHTGAERISQPISRCLVFEDAPSGIRAGVASGAKTLAVCTSHERDEVERYGADFVVQDLTRVTAKVLEDGTIEVEIDQS